jgi:plastocyanin
VPRLRRIALAAALLGSSGAAAGAALAADREVVARDLAFTPSKVAVMPGDTLTIRHDDRLTAHDLQFGDEPNRRVEAGTGWTVERTFSAAEQRDAPYTFFCSLHPGMSGVVYVNATGTVPSPTPAPTTSATASATATATATATAAPGSPGAPAQPGAPSTGPLTAATLRSAAIAPRACMRRSARCQRPGARLRIDLSAPADVRGTLRRRAPGARRFRAFGALRFGRVAAGPVTLTFTRTASGKRLRPGRYRLALRAAASTRALAFRVL